MKDDSSRRPTPQPAKALGVVAATVLTLVASVLGLAPTAGATNTPAAGPSSGVQITLDSVSPQVLTGRKNTTLRLHGEVVNTGSRTTDPLTVGLRARDEPLGLRYEVTDRGAADTTRVTSGSRSVAPLAPGARVPWTISVRGDRLPLLRTSSAHVYLLAVEAYRTSGGDQLAALPTYLPYLPSGGWSDQAQRLQVATLWPLVDRPHRDGTTLGNDAQTPVFTDDTLAGEFAPGGRLDRVVASGSGLHVTWAVDGDLLDSAAAMRDGYRVAPPGSSPADTHNKKQSDTHDQKRKNTDSPDDDLEPPSTPADETNTLPGGGGATAAGWLDRVRRTAGSSGQIVSLPYADTDVAAVAHAGSGTNLVPLLSAATTKGADVTQHVFGPKVRGDVAWPADGAVDKAVLDTARAGGANLVIASGDSLATSDSLSYTPSARYPLTDTANALVGDPQIAKVLASDLSTPTARAQATQQLLAELMLIPLEQPTIKRTVLITPPREMSADVASVLRTVLTASQGAKGWSDGVSLDEIAGVPPLPKETQARSLQTYPREAAATQPSPSYLQRVAAVQSSLETFAGILTRPERVTGPYAPAVLRTLSTEWRSDAADADAFRVAVTRSLRQLESLVYVVRKSGVTLSGDSGSIPVTVVNNLQQPVVVRLQMTSRQPNRLKLGDPVTVTVPAGHVPVTKFPATAAANGKVLVDVQLYTPNGGAAFGPSETFFVNTTSIDGLTLGLIATIAGLLAVFSVRAYVVRRRRNAAAPPDDGPTPGGPAGDDPGGPEPHEPGHGPFTHDGSPPSAVPPVPGTRSQNDAPAGSRPPAGSDGQWSVFTGPTVPSDAARHGPYGGWNPGHTPPGPPSERSE